MNNKIFDENKKFIIIVINELEIEINPSHLALGAVQPVHLLIKNSLLFNLNYKNYFSLFNLSFSY